MRRRKQMMKGGKRESRSTPISCVVASLITRRICSRTFLAASIVWYSGSAYESIRKCICSRDRKEEGKEEGSDKEKVEGGGWKYLM